MNPTSDKRRWKWPGGWRAGVTVILLLLLGGFALSPWGRGVRSRARALVHVARAVLDRPSEESGGDFADVIFLHHSTGRNLIAQGGVRERLTAAGFRFWDHDYNAIGLTRPDGTRAGYSYNVPNDNTDPNGLAVIFAQREYDLPLNTLSGLLQHNVIVFKSCFPVNNISSEEQLERYKAYYRGMRDVMDRHPEKIFIVVTPPPLNPAATDAETAARARAFADWLTSDEFLAGHVNLFTFDFFDLLAEGDATDPDFNTLRAAYRTGDDSHPNRTANETIGPLFADFIVTAVETYRDSSSE